MNIKELKTNKCLFSSTIYFVTVAITSIFMIIMFIILITRRGKERERERQRKREAATYSGCKGHDISL